jgi:hypothetical protein
MPKADQLRGCVLLLIGTPTCFRAAADDLGPLESFDR